jgi:hypothetical protein
MSANVQVDVLAVLMVGILIQWSWDMNSGVPGLFSQLTINLSAHDLKEGNRWFSIRSLRPHC